MSLIVAAASFCHSGMNFQKGGTYDTAGAVVNTVNTAVPHLFYASGGTKTCTGTFEMRDSRAGGFDRFVHIGEVLPSGDPAVTAAPLNFR